MPIILLKFAIILGNRRSGFSGIYGPLFHRWLPDGEKDAIILDVGDSNAKIKVWFERSGFVNGNFISFDYKRREVDPEVIPKQAVLDAGPLRGLLKIGGVSEQELMCLREQKVGDAGYIALGKRVVKQLIYPPVRRFLDILCTNYGQYWITTLDEWDSRRESLGSYCVNKLQLEWSVEESGDWTAFVPNDPIIEMTALFGTTSSHYHDYLKKEDWEEIARVVQGKYQPSLAAFILVKAHELFEQGNLKYALIEAVTALEIALNEFIDQKLQGTDSLRKCMSRFMELPLSVQLALVETILGKVPIMEIESAVEAIEMRNKVVHDGWNPPDDAKTKILRLIKTIAVLLSGPRFRFPSGQGNLIMPTEEWDKERKEDTHTS